ncbi:hypothetical protein [Spiroplasma endosymbiont of Polydrusus pterygomalis]|uniref:hypothetical protein n=1 Tax=Spiroplasma endosymbiont of Polydrusus pterygomalis TaxID=3139327 RepID=UPI003CCA9681
MNKDQKIINEYNKKRNKEITEEHLNNIKKIREEFKQKVINKYNEKLIIWLNKQISICLCDSLKEAGKLTAYYKVIEFIENGEFH